MGNKITNNSHIQIHLTCDKNFHLAGETVDGTIWIISRNHLPFSILQLKLEVREVHEGNSQQQMGKVRNSCLGVFRGNNILFSHKYDIERYTRGIRMGFYELPFSIRLPSDLPGTIVGNEKQPSILYQLIAELTKQSVPPDQINPKAKILLNVEEPPRYPPGCKALTAITDPQCCFCFPRGMALTNVLYQKNITKSGERIPLQIIQDLSQCQQATLNTTARLVNTIFLQSNGGKTKRIRKVLQEQLIGGLIKPHDRSVRNIFVYVPTTIQNSTALGNLVANYYTVQVSSQLESYCCSTTQGPIVSQQVYIKALEPRLNNCENIFELPPDWNPEKPPKKIFSQHIIAGFHPNPKIEMMNKAAQMPF